MARAPSLQHPGQGGPDLGEADRLLDHRGHSTGLYLDRIEAWIAEGTVGGDAPNAADIQIGTALSAMLAMDDLRPFLEGRRSGDLARRVLPEYPGRLPSVVPPGWASGHPM